MTSVPGVDARAASTPDRAAEVLTPEALEFLAGLHREFDARRRELRRARKERHARWLAGETPSFLPPSEAQGDWRAPEAPPDLRDRRVEITGPTSRRMVINALNSGARVFMADFEDANSPTWANMVEGQANLIDAVRRTITLENPDGSVRRLNDQTATLVVRPRGWHLPERHLLVDGQPISGALFDLGLYLFHNARELLERGSGPYVYLPKLESHLEARLWNDVFEWAQQRVGVPSGSIRATVLVETLPAALEVEEILYELRDHLAGANPGRWDYLFSVIKELGDRPGSVLPDRASVTMMVPFMRAYTERIVSICHRHGAYAIGGMAAYIPNRRDAEAYQRAVDGVRADKVREAGDGFDGTWVAHPDLVDVGLEVFDGVLGERPHQLERTRDEVATTVAELVDLHVPDAQVTEGGLRGNVDIAVRYTAAWLGGTGAVALDNLMEDAATAEIARSQVWQWLRHGAPLAEGGTVTRDRVTSLFAEARVRLREEAGGDEQAAHFEQAADLIESLVISEDCPPFLTLPAYELLEGSV